MSQRTFAAETTTGGTVDVVLDDEALTITCPPGMGMKSEPIRDPNGNLIDFRYLGIGPVDDDDDCDDDPDMTPLIVEPKP